MGANLKCVRPANVDLGDYEFDTRDPFRKERLDKAIDEIQMP